MTEKKREETYQKLHRLWLRQLLLEFENICLDYEVDLQAPVFSINRSEIRLGGWNPTTRTITLSQHLIINNSWSITLHVLKHEMAHQLCSEKWGVRGRPHGEVFLRACELLGVPLEYRAAQAELHKVVEAEGGAKSQLKNGRRLQQRVEKLLALSQSGNEHEAALALEKAHELVRKYHLDQEVTDYEPHFGFIVIDKKKKRLASYQKSICMILSEYFLVRVVISERYDPLFNDSFKIIELLGSKEKLAIAEYCYYYLENQLALLWEANKGRFPRGNKRSQKNSYYLGILHGFYSHLGLDKKSRTELAPGIDKRGLIKVNEMALDEYVQTRFPHLSKGSRRKMKVKKDIYDDGVESGRAMRFSQGIKGDQKTLLDI